MSDCKDGCCVDVKVDAGWMRLDDVRMSMEIVSSCQTSSWSWARITSCGRTKNAKGE